MQRHGYAYRSAVATDAPRVTINPNEVILFYTTTLSETVNRTHPSLVFNMDEMSAEMFADRRNMHVFVRRSRTGKNTVRRLESPAQRRCTLVGCIRMDGTRPCPAIIKTETGEVEIGRVEIERVEKQRIYFCGLS